MRIRRFISTTVVAIVLAIGSLAPVLPAQEANKPIAIVSISPLDRMLQDTSFLLRAANVPEMGGLVTMMANQYSQGIDRSRPLGAAIFLENQNPSALVFLPLVDRSKFFGALAGMGIEPDDLGDGLFEIDAGGQTIFAKDSGNWLFIAQTENALETVPTDPAALLGGLHKRYDMAIRLNVQDLPPEMKDMATQQLRIGFERSMAEQRGQTEEERAEAEKMGQASIEQIEQLIADTERVILGWAVDSDGHKTYFDGGIQFVAGSKLAAQADLAAKQTSDYTAFILPDSSARFRFSSTIAESDKPVAKNNLRNSISQAARQIDQSDDMPDEAKALLKDLLNGLGTITEKTIDEGIFDGASSLSVAGNKLRVLIGGRISDGKALADEFKKAAAQLPTGPDAPTLEFDYETYKGVTLHRARIPVKIADPGAKKVFGDELLLTIGTGAKQFLLALDPDGDASAKAALDAMAAKPGAAATPMEAVVEFEQLLRFAQGVSPNPYLDNAISTISEYAGMDKIEVSGSVIPRGGVYRLSIDEGVMRSIGAAAKSGGGGGGF